MYQFLQLSACYKCQSTQLTGTGVVGETWCSALRGDPLGILRRAATSLLRLATSAGLQLGCAVFG